MYISRVEEGSVAERAGLRPGDSILEVNGTPFTGISHEEALKVSSHFIYCLNSRGNEICQGSAPLNKPRFFFTTCPENPRS